MSPDIGAIARPLKYYRTTPTKAAAPMRVERTGGKFKAGLIRGVSLLSEGEALGHDHWVDGEFVASVAGAVNQLNRGSKVRFTHPSVSGDGLGRYMGRAINGRVEGGKAVADIHLAKASHETPDGDLGKYVMGLAEEDPEAFAISIAFERDREAEDQFAAAHEGGDGFESPATGNVANHPHTRLKALVAADFVDTPAANPDGLFHMGEDIADEADRLCAYAFGLSDEKPELSCFSADVDRVAEFAQRFLNSRGLIVMSNKPEVTPEQVTDTVPKAEYDALAAKVSEMEAKFAELTAAPVDPEPNADDVQLAERQRVAELYKLANSACLDNATESAEKWADQGLSLVEAKAALADTLLARNGLTNDSGKPADDPDAKQRAEYHEYRAVYEAEGVSVEDYIASSKITASQSEF